MPLFDNILQKLRLQKLHGEGEIYQTAQQSHSSPSILSDSPVQAQGPDHQDTTMTTGRETAFAYIQTQFMDNSVLADTIDSEDLQRSPEGPTRILDNFNMNEIDSDTSSADESVYYMENGRIKPQNSKMTIVGTNGSKQPQHDKRYDPPFRSDAGEDWRLRAARNLKGTGSLRSFSNDHLRDRHFFQSRTVTPQSALQAAWQQTQNEMRALQLENEAVMDAATLATRKADMMEGELIALEIKIQKMRANIGEMRKRIERRKAEIAKEIVEQM